jgi:hypothetical protein
MRAASAVSFGALVASTFAQTNTGVFEPTDFNITEALIDNGIDVSTIPELSGLIERTLNLNFCSIAVSYIMCLE